MKFLYFRLLLMLACAWPAARLVRAETGPLRVFVSIPPQEEFVSKVGGGRVQVNILLDRGQSPHSFEPSPRAIARLGDTRLFFRIGLPYERRIVARLASAFAGLEVVDTRAGITLRRMEGDPDGRAGDDPHIWLDPKLVKIQAATICAALTRLDPAGEASYKANLAAFQTALDGLDRELTVMLAPFRGQPVYVYHPAFGYFLDAYGLQQRAVQPGGHEPSARELAALVERMRTENVRTLFVQPEFPSPVADALQQTLGCNIVRLNPLAADYMANMRRMARRVAEALSEQNR